MPIYTCSISGYAPRVPVITNETITYDFVSIAKSLLRGENTNNDSGNPLLDPGTRQPIDTLIYNRSIKDSNDELMEVVPLSDEETNEIASFYRRLTHRYHGLRIYGLHALKGMTALIGAPMLSLNT